MERSDRFDTRLGKHFAWCFVPPGGAVDARDLRRRLMAASPSEGEKAGVPAAPGRPIEPAPLLRSQDRPRTACRSLARSITEAYPLAEEAGARATKRLLARADRLGVELVAMATQPLEAVRLLRLFVRYRSALTRRQRERSAAVATLLPLDHPEVAELFVELAWAGDRVLTAALLSDEDWVPDLAGRDRVVAELIRIVEAGPTADCRIVALDLLGRLGRPDASIAVLRCALHLPTFGVRARALHALAMGQPCLVLGEDLVHLLRDLLAHAPADGVPDDEREEEERMFADAVLRALAHVRPEGAEEALLDWIDAEHESVWLDESWATEALAVAFPETAAVMVDHWLKCARAHERTRALAALARLPDPLAGPRLRLAVSDPAFSVRDPARRQWFDRYGNPCPNDVTGLPGAALLDGPPSEIFLSRLIVMHGRVREARRVLARALLTESPSREALVLLLQWLGDDADSAEPNVGSPEEAWAATVVRHFGALGVEGLAALAARYPEPESFGWLRRLGDLVERGTIGPESVGPLRPLAAAHVASEDAGRVDDALRLLLQVGAPPDLLPRLIAIGLTDDLGAFDARALVVAWPDRAIDSGLVSEMALALAERDWTRLEHAAAMSLGRGSPAARVVAQRVLEVAECEPSAADAAVECARHLKAAGALSDDWALSALARPDSPIFAVAALAWRGQGAVRTALDRALASRDRGCASAVHAAIALLHAEPPLSLRDRRLSALLQAAPPAERASLIYAMCVHGASLSLVGEPLAELLASHDPEVTRSLLGLSAWLTSSRGRSLLRSALPRVVDPELRADIEDALGMARLGSSW